MRKLFLSTVAAVLILTGSVSAQLIGTKNIPGDYATLDLAIIDLNLQGVGPGGVTFNVLPGNPQAAPAGGYVITATGTAANPIGFMGNGNTVTTSAALTVGNLNDGIFKIIGGDYIAIATFVMMENPANTVTAAATNNMTEWGIALLQGSATDGCQFNAITANVISLNRTYQNTFGIYSNTRHTPTAVTVTADITAASGSNSNNVVYQNNISNVNYGIVFIGSGSTTAGLQDYGNDIGGSAALTGNTISNAGGIGVAPSGYISLTGNNYLIFMYAQNNDNISYNSITSASGTTTGTITLGGLLKNHPATAPTGTITTNITNNTVTLTNTPAASATGALIGLNTQGTSNATATTNINNNTILNCAILGANATSNTLVGITNLSAVGTLNMSNNVLRGLATSATTGQIQGIVNSGAVVTAANINNNSFGNTLSGYATTTVASSATLFGVVNTGGASTAAITITGNDVRGITYNVLASSTNVYIQNTSTSLSQNISNNTFTNLNINTTGNVFFITNDMQLPANGVQTINNNSIVTAFNKAGAGGTVQVYLASTTPSSPTTASHTATGNNFSNITVTGATTLIGWQNLEGAPGPTKTITGNTFNNWTGGSSAITGIAVQWSGTTTISNNIFTNITGTGAITGISFSTSTGAFTQTCNSNTITGLVSTGTGGTVLGITGGSNTATSLTVNDNIIHTLSSTGASSNVIGINIGASTVANINNNDVHALTSTGTTAPGVTGIAVAGTTTLNLGKNKVYDISSNSTGATVMGISSTGGGTTRNITNNLVGDLRASAANAAGSVVGINLAGANTANVYYNTVHLNATSTGTNFGSYGISSVAATTLDMRNNLVVNLSTANGTGQTVAYRRNNTTLTSYANSSNNNSFYAGTPSASNLIFTDGTNNDQTFAAYQARVAPRDASSLSENPTFMSLSGASPSFLHIAAATASLLESGGSVIPAVTTDYDNDARPGPVGSVNGGAIAPDIGADEFDGVLLICTGTPTAGTVAGSPLSRCVSGTFTLSATGASSGPGITYQWQESPTSGGPYTNVPSANTLTFTTASISTTTYYVLVVTCANSAQTVTSSEITASVFPNPVVSVSPTTATICSVGATPVTLTASGATTYAWSPTTALTPSTGSPVSAAPTSSTTYTVTGTDANGCTGTASATITVVETPSVISVTATPTSVCNNGSSQLLATAGNTSAYTQTTVPFVPINSGTGTVVLCNATVATTPTTAGTLDDGYWNGIAMPFNFTYFGSTFNTIHVQTNGAVSFSPFTTTTGYNVTMPNTAAPNNLIAACFGDMDWRFGNGMISCYTSGVAPNRVFVINYNGNTGGGFYNSGNPPTAIVNMQVHLFETTNIIQIQSASIGGPTTVNHAQGIENAGGTTGLIVTGRNNTTWTATNEGIQFAPSGGTPTFTWTPPTFLSATNIANPMATGITATTTYTVVASEGGCSSAPASVTVTAGSLLSSTNSVTPSNTVCSGTDVSFNVAPVGGGLPYTYSWAGPNSFTSIAQNPTIIGATTAASGTYTVIVTDNCGSTSTTSVTITVNPLPAVAVTPTTALYCNPGAPIALSATGASTYTWGPAAGLSATTGASVDASPLATTIYTVTGTDGNGCVSTATTTITSAPAVNNAVATVTPGTICEGSTTTLAAVADAIPMTLLTENFNSGAPAWTRTNTSTGGNPAVAEWTDRPDGYVYAAGTPYHSNDNSQFVQTNSDPQGSGSTTRTTLESPAFSTVGTTNLAVDFYHYYRDIADNGDTAIIESSLDGINWTIVTIYTATTGSEAAFTHDIVPLPSALDNQPTVYVRFRFKATWDWYWSIDNVSVVGMGQNFTYNWSSTPSGFASTAASPTDAPSVSTTYSVVISATGGCSATASTSVTVNPLPIVALSGATSFCAGDSTLLTGTSGGTSQWYLNGAPIVGATSDTHQATAAGVYNMVKTNANGNGCENTDMITVTVNPLPTVVANSTATAVCDGSPVTLTGSGAASYTWAATMTVTDNVAFTPTATDTYTVTGTDVNGCENTDMITVTVNTLPTVVANSTATTVCSGSSVTLTGSGAISYTWAAAISVTDNVAFNPTATDTYTVTGTDGNGCTDTDMITVTVNALPTVVANSTATAVCDGSPVTLTGSGATSYTWAATMTVTDNVAFTPTATDTYTVTGTDGNGCTNTDMITVTVNALPTVTAVIPQSSVCVDDGNLTLTGGSPAAGTWSGTNVAAGIFNPTTVGSVTITYTYTDGNGCTNSATDNISVDACTGIITVGAVAEVTVYPNPNEGQFTIQLPAVPTSSVQVEVMNELGQVVDAFTMTGTTKEVNISTLEGGVYFVRVINEGNVSVHRVVKQ
jgi:hypothetical protein